MSLSSHKDKGVLARRWDVPLVVLGCAIFLLIGMSMPLFNIERLVFWKNEYSVLSGVVGLYHDREYGLAVIIFLFSVVFPIIKLVVLWIIWQFRFTCDELQKILHWLGILGKWSMLDVFVVAVMIVAVKLGPLAKVHPREGIYVFCGAIIASILTSMWVERLARKAIRSDND